MCFEQEDFLSDLIKFLVSRGHGRLIPPAGAEGFPEVVLNGKRLDLYNLYREVWSLLCECLYLTWFLSLATKLDLPIEVKYSCLRDIRGKPTSFMAGTFSRESGVYFQMKYGNVTVASV